MSIVQGNLDETGLLFSIPLGEGLPTEVMLFPIGETKTDKGSFFLSEEDASEVIKDFEERGRDRLPFDVAHGMLPKPDGKGGVTISSDPEAHKAYGWFIPRVASIEGVRGLIASEIEWTPAGAEAVGNKEFRFHSPSIHFDGETRRILKLINVALTNLPATQNQRPLVLDALEAETITEETENMQALLSSLDAADEASAVAKVGEFKASTGELQALLSAFEVKTHQEAIASLDNLKATAEKAIAAEAQLSSILQERAVEKRAAAIESAGAEGKLVNKEFAESLSEDHFTKYLATLSANTALLSSIEGAGSKSSERIEGSERSAEEMFPGIVEAK